MPEPSPARWLSLLDAEAELEAFEAYRAEALKSAPAERRAEVEREATRALRIRAHLLDRKHQAEEMVVLNDLARRLAGLRSSSEVLQEVAVQARRLLAVDVAYIMLLRPAGELRIEFSDGAIGTVLRGIELAPGQGLGGQVVNRGAPLWSRDYLRDTASHTVRRPMTPLRSSSSAGSSESP